MTYLQTYLSTCRYITAVHWHLRNKLISWKRYFSIKTNSHLCLYLDLSGILPPFEVCSLKYCKVITINWPNNHEKKGAVFVCFILGYPETWSSGNDLSSFGCCFQQISPCWKAALPLNIRKNVITEELTNVIRIVLSQKVLTRIDLSITYSSSSLRSRKWRKRMWWWSKSNIHMRRRRSGDQPTDRNEWSVFFDSTSLLFLTISN